MTMPRRPSAGRPGAGPWLADLRGRAEGLLAWLVPALAAAVACAHRITLADLGWQLQLGRLMAQAGPFLHERFVHSHLGEPLMPNAWLAQVIYARLFETLGWTGLRAADMVLWVSGPLVATIPARLRPGKALPIVLALLISYVVAMPSASIRPQSFASLGFGLMLVLIQTVRSWRIALLLGLPLFVAWQNLHPSVPLAVLVTGALAAMAWLRHAPGQTDRPIALTVLAASAAAAIFATPAGPGILAFAGVNATASVAFGATEWLPLWHPYNRSMFVFVLISATFVLFATARHRRTMPVAEWLPAAILFALTLLAARFALFYAIAIVPPLTRLALGRAPLRPAGAQTVLAGCALSALSVAAVCLALPLPRPGPDQQAFAALAQSGSRGTAFTDPTLGGAVILSGFPRWQVAFDGRYFLYRPEERALLDRSNSDGRVLPDIERIYHPTAYALDKTSSAALVHTLSARPDTWRRVYDHADVVLFVRSRP